MRDIVLRGGSVLFVGTKKQAKETIYRTSTRCGMYYVNERWLGGTLTNNVTIRKSIGRLRELEAMSQNGTFEKLSKKEVARLLREKAKLHKYLDGIKDMDGLPKALFVVDTRRDRIAVAEARKMGVPVVAMVDSNSDPDPIDYPIPANDDAIKSVSLLSNVIADYIVEAQNEVYKAQPEAAPEKKRATRTRPAEVSPTQPVAREAPGVVEPEAPVIEGPELPAEASSEGEQQPTPDTISEPPTEEKGN